MTKIIKKEIISYELQNIYFGEKSKCILNGVNIKFEMNGVMWIKSAHGEGKSLLIKIMSGLLSPTRGQVLINGLDLYEMSFDEFLPYRLNIGYSFDMGGLIANKTVFQNLMLPLQYHKILEDDKAEIKVMELLGRFNLKDKAHLLPSAVPGGIRKVTTVLRAMILAPEVLLLDEPTLGLSDEFKEIMTEMIETLIKKNEVKQIIVSSQDSLFMEFVASNVAEIENKVIKHRVDDEFNFKKKVI